MQAQSANQKSTGMPGTSGKGKKQMPVSQRRQPSKKTKTKKIPRKLIASIPVDNTICRLLDLPPELRTRIYEYVLAPHSPTTTITKSTLAQPPLLRTCHAIRSEASSLYYLDTNFHFDIKDFDTALFRTFCRQTGVYLHEVSVDFRIMRSSRSWSNLLVWLEAYYARRAVDFRCEEECGFHPCCAASMGFELVERVRDELAWEKVLPLLEILKMALEPRRFWS